MPQAAPQPPLDPPPPPPGLWRFALSLIAVAWAAAAWMGVRGHASTFDEPVHTVAAAHAVRGEFALNPEHPPVWKFLAGLPLPPPPPVPDSVRGSPVNQWPYAVDVLYRSDWDGEAVVGRSRVALLAFGVGVILLGGLIATAGAGPRAGALAAALLALDPLLLAHGPIVSNDVALTALLLAVVAVAWTLRTRLEHPLGITGYALAVILGGLMGLAIGTKFTALLLAPLLAAALLLTRRHLGHRGLLVLLVAAPMAYATVWVVYGFRYDPSPDGRPLDLAPLVDRVAAARRIADPSAGPDPDTATRLILAANDYRLLPQAFSAGLLTSYGVTRSNPAFLMGELRLSGWWWYFPVALLFKTPLAVLAVWAIALGGLVRRHTPTPAGTLAWLAIAALAVSMASPLNIGVRHVLPATVLLTLAGGIMLAARPRLAAGLLVVLAAEVAVSYPHWLSFFNLPARVYGPDRLLADSNLDWGQDLARLAEWHREAGRPPLFLAYWGTGDPAAYGLAGDVTHLPGTYPFHPQSRPPPRGTVEGAYLAVSVSYLQGIQSGEVAPFFARLRQEPPERVIGSSIYLYRW